MFNGAKLRIKNEKTTIMSEKMSICSTISVKSVRIDRQCDSTFANGEVKGVKGVKGVKEVKTYVLLLKNYAKKTIVLTPQRP